MDFNIREMIQKDLDWFVFKTHVFSAGFEVEIKQQKFSMINSALNTSTNIDNERRMETLSNYGYFWYEHSVDFIHDTEQNDYMIRLLLSRIDQIEQALLLDDYKQKNHIMQTILDELPEMIAVKNLDQEYVISNLKADMLFKDKFDTIVGKTIADLYGEIESERVISFDKQTIRDARPVMREFTMKSPNGSFQAEATRLPAYRTDGQLFGVISINRNIEEMKIIQQQLMKSLEFQETLIKIAMDFINVPDHKADMAIQESLKTAGERILADRVYVFDYDFIAGTTSNTYEWCADDVKPEIENLQNIPVADIEGLWLNFHRKREMVYIHDLNDIDHDSDLYYILAPQGIKSLLTIPLFHEDQLTGFVGFDATQQVRDWSVGDRNLLKILAELIVNLKVKINISHELVKQREKAEQFSKVKSQFLANMSHEIRTPLSGIYSAINLLLKTQFTPKQLEYLELAKLSIETLSGIVNDILDISRIEQGKLSIDIQDICLEKEMFQIAKLEELLIEQKGLKFIYDFDYRIRHEVQFDRIRLRQIMINLTHNSIKYTESGSIRITVKLVSEDNTDYQVQFSVEDTGSGIPKEALPFITEPFFQVDQTTAKAYQGTGLGLSIVKEILQYFQAPLEINSELGIGTRVSFIVRMKKGKILFNQHQLINQSVIIIQDDALPNDAGIQFYESMGMHAKRVSASKYQSIVNQMFDWVVLELDLDLVTNQWIHHIKQQFFSNHTQLILCNLIGKEYSDADIESKGIQFILNFPLTRAKVIEMLESKFVNSSNSLKPIPRTMFYQDAPVLIVDDNPINLQALGSILEIEDIIVEKANCGQTAIDMIQEKPYSIVLMDVQMPRMDGYEATRIIRKLGYSKQKLPIIAVTANVTSDSKQLALDSGMNGHISKPFHPDDLMEMIIEHMNQSSIKSLNEVTIPDERMPFNAVHLMSLFKNKTYLGEKVISSFFEEYGTNVHDLQKALNSKNYIEVGKIAHYMKGSASYAAAERVVWICEEIMRTSSSQNSYMLQKLIDLIDPEIHEWIGAVNKWQKEMVK
jgi:signal transduction histidine kinase/ActR/RegA family two-component response regulator/PAS domain-containing protein